MNGRPDSSARPFFMGALFHHEHHGHTVYTGHAKRDYPG